MLLREVEYARPATVEEAVARLSEHDGARALAGGQTLVNVMKARAASPDVLVDLAQVTYIDSSGIASLIEGLQTARKQKNDLALVSVSPRARRVF